MAKTLNLSPSQTRAAFVTYSTLPRTIAPLRGYTTQQFDQLVDRASLLRGTRRIDLAIDEAARMLKANGERPKKIVVLLTAGRQTPGDKTLRIAAQPLRDIGADLYVMAIGSLVNIEELLPTVDKPEDIFRIPSHEVLSEHYKPISAEIANRAGTRSLVPEDFTAEVVFLVDASVTVTPANFESEKEFVKAASRSLQISPDKTRAAVITYSETTENVVELGKYQTLADFDLKVDSARLLGFARRMDKALESAADTLRKSRPGVPRLVVLLTAGQQLPSATSLDRAVQPLKNLGAQTFVVAIGNQPDIRELTKAVEKPEDLFRVTGYEKLPGDAKRIVILVSKRASVPQSTDFAADIVFMLDASSTVNLNDYRTEKDFVKALAKLLNVAPGKSRASLVTYSNNPRVIFKLNGYRNSLDFEQQVDRAPWLGGSRRMDKALETAGTILNEARRNAPKIAVLLTTGRQTSERDTKLLDEAIKPLDSVGAKTYVIAIGKKPDMRELSLAVKKMEDVIQVYSFRNLLAKTQPVAQKMRKESQLAVPEPLHSDIVFLMDSSSFVSLSNFEREKSFVKSLAHFLNVNPGKSRASVVSFSSNPQLVFRFNDYRSQREFNNSVDRVPYLSGRSRRIDKAVAEAVTIFKEARADAAKILVLLTSGVQTPEPGAKNLHTAFEPLRKQGVKNIVVAVGSNIDGKEFEKLLDKPKDLLRVNSFVTLPTQGKDSSDKITMSLMEPLDLTADIVFVVDSSSTVDRPNYKKERDFVKSLARALNVANGKSRAGVITYGRNSRVETKFNDYRTTSEFEQIVEDALYMGGGRRMDRALESAAQMLSLARPQAKKIVVFFTAGRQALGAKSLESAVRPVHERGAKVFVVALGEEPDIEKLTSIVSQPEDIFRVPSFDGLKKRVVPTSRVIAARSDITKVVPQKSVADIVFLADSSSDVPTWRFNEQKEFVKKLSKTFNIAPDGSRASFVSYGSAQILVGGFHNTPSTFDSAVTTTAYVGGNRRLDLAVNAALKLFKESRPGVSKVLVLITAGRNSPESAPLSSFTQQLQDSGIHTYVITIGALPDAADLLPIVDERSDIIPVTSYDRLPSRVNDIQLIILQSFRPLKPLDLSADVIFMVDTSSDVRPETIKLQKDFVKTLSKQFNIAPGKARVALIVYGSRGDSFVKLDSVSTLSDFTSLVDRAPIIGGRRRMDKALDTASLILTGARPRVPKIAFLLTAGAQAPGTPEKYLSTAARLLQNLDARTYVIAIGNQVIEQEIGSIPEKPRDIIRVTSASQLPSSVVSVFNVIVQDYGKLGPLGHTHDVVFVIDSSSTVATQDFERQKQFVKSFARQFGISRDRSRGALVTYGRHANLDVRFDGYENLDDFDAAVDGAERVGGERRMGRALDMASRVLHEARPKAYKVAILFTAGTQSQAAGTWLMESASHSLKNIGAKTYVVAIGNQPDTRELRPLVDRDSDILPVVSLANIGDLTGRTITLVTDGTGPLKPSKVTTDIVFLTDSSSSVTTQDYALEKEFVKNLAQSMSVAPGKSRGALITYGSIPRTVFGFDGYKTVQDFNRNVDNAPYIGGSKQIDTALNSAKTLLDRESSQAVKMVVLLTSDTQMTDQTRRRLNEVTKGLRSSGVLVYVITIGSRPNFKDWGAIVDRPDDVMTVKRFTDLRPYVDSAVRQIMNGVTSRLNFKADIVFMMDGSIEVSSASFAREKELIKTLARYFNVQPGGSRAGVIVYGSSSGEVLGLGADQSLSTFDLAVDRARLVGGTRRIDRALESAARLFLSSRKDVPKIAVLLTTGRQAQEPGAKPLEVARQPLTDLNARLYVIGIGQRADVSQMNKIASSPSDVFVLRLPSDLLSKVPAITQQTKKTSNQRKVRQPLPSTDAIFLIDSSDDVTTDEYERQKDIIKSITRSFDIGLTNTRVAVIAYGDRGRNVIEFDTHGNILDLHRGIDNIPYLGGRRRLDVAVTQANALLSETRPQANKVVFLLTTGLHRPALGSTPLRTAALPLHDKAQVFVIGLGSKPNVQELRQLASRDGNVYMIPSSGKMLPQIEVIQIQVASGIETPKQVSDQKIDLLFVVDSSDSVGRTNFLKSKEFVKAFVRAFQVSPDKTHVALIRFGNTADLSIRFGEYSSIRDFNRAVDNVAFVGGTKRLDKALVLAARVLPKARPSSKKIAIIISDGKQAQGPGVEPLDFAAQPLHGIGANVYVIGTGQQVDIPKLQKITQKPGDLFVSRSYDDLLQQMLYLMRHMTKGPTTSPSGYIADVMFLVDSSNSLTEQEFQYQKDFIREISRRLRVSPVATRAGFITYNDNARLRTNFDSYNTTADFYSQLSQIQKEGGGRRLDKAIELAGQTFAGVRRNAAKLLIIFAKGRSITDPDSKPLSEVMRPLKNQGVVTNVLAIGPGVDMVGLTSVAPRPENILIVDSYGALRNQVQRIWKHIVGTTVVRCNQTLDVGIVMDSSGSLGPVHYSKQRDFIKSIIRELITASPRSRVGIIPFSDYAEVAINFEDFESMSASALDASIDGLPYEQGRTRIDRALDTANRGLFNTKRYGVPQVLILITDGRQSKDLGYTPVNQAILPLRYKGIKTLTVGIGKYVDLDELKLITPENVFLVGAFDELEGIVRGLVTRSCSL